MSNLRDAVMLQSPTGEADDGGHADLSLDASWQDHGQFHFLKIHSQGSRELYHAQQVRAETSHVVDVWYTPVTAEITPCYRWKAGSRIFEVVSALNFREENRIIRMTLFERF